MTALGHSSSSPPLPSFPCFYLKRPIKKTFNKTLHCTAEDSERLELKTTNTLRDSAPCLSRAATPPEGHHIGARKRRASGNTILSQPYRRRVSTDRLNREGSQLTASLEGEPGPTPAGKTLPHSYPETKFWREGRRNLVNHY